jgi:hypothetical protein
MAKRWRATDTFGLIPITDDRLIAMGLKLLNGLIRPHKLGYEVDMRLVRLPKKAK